MYDACDCVCTTEKDLLVVKSETKNERGASEWVNENFQDLVSVGFPLAAPSLYPGAPGLR